MTDAAETSTLPGWKSLLGWAAAGAMALMWLVAGLWKLTNLSGFQLMLTQMLVPVQLSLAGAVAMGVVETFTGVLLLRPAWRRHDTGFAYRSCAGPA